MGARVVVCFSFLGMFLPIVFGLFWEICRDVSHSWCVGHRFWNFAFGCRVVQSGFVSCKDRDDEVRIPFSSLLSVFRGFEGLFSRRIVHMSSSDSGLGIEIPRSVCARLCLVSCGDGFL